ncbi:MAG TPA: sulfite exporter TauE/SafE family protein [Persephonella sp.]|uniref:sulfite exporter TauE/SafE family protein n=1 Tax=Persephonella TaxID=182899 RepID=UPI0005A12EFC|nr:MULTISPECIES: sulfite exporter TauE/SafE family protein [Persephonella]HCB70011.1 sulfite exporter TauE/SafE family protein [Persephonella sp.]
MILKYLLISLAGFLGSYHCVGMCGFIPPLIIHRSWLIGNILYSAGRLFTYSFLGFIAGYLGMFFHSMQFQYFQKGLSIFLGVMMIFFGLQVAGSIKEKGVIGLDLIFTTVAEILSKFRKNPFFLGMFNGFLPCPLVYAFLMQAVFERDPLKGATVMLFFGLGTIPAMLFASKLFQILSPRLRKKVSSFAGFIIIILGIWIILRAFGIGHHH